MRAFRQGVHGFPPPQRTFRTLQPSQAFFVIAPLDGFIALPETKKATRQDGWIEEFAEVGDTRPLKRPAGRDKCMTRR
jgi:hypothetical protein